jgi:hypothetical protein
LLGCNVIIDWIDDSKLIVQKGDTGLTGNLYFGLSEFSDMMFLRMAVNELNISFEKLDDRNINNPYTYDVNINDIVTHISGNRVYMKNTNTYLLNLHFQGSSKSLTKNYLSLLEY